MDDFMTDVAAARLGAACSAARSPWPIVAAAGVNHALGQSLALAAGRVDEHRAAFRPVPAPQTAQRLAQQTQSAVLMTELLPTTGTVTGIASVDVTRKPKNVHKTRINAGGYGAMGPYPERERLA